jgi:NAD(P)-dependent dehydrogenase (short-subunit alcohol dehydrogenase family)
MSMADTSELDGKRVLLLGAEAERGREIAAALGESGMRLALVGSSNDSETAFAVQRLARKVGAEVSQAIDATNEMAVRVMVRQVVKALGGLDAVVCAVPEREAAADLLRRFAEREFTRQGIPGVFVSASAAGGTQNVIDALAAPVP